jgi:hypothetical protein
MSLGAGSSGYVGEIHNDRNPLPSSSITISNGVATIALCNTCNGFAGDRGRCLTETIEAVIAASAGDGVAIPSSSRAILPTRGVPKETAELILQKRRVVKAIRVAAKDQPSARCMSNFESVLDRIKLCDLLYRDKMFNEFYRLKTFDSYKELIPEAARMAELGFYFSGKTYLNDSVIAFVHVTCAFCDFEHKFTPAECRLPINYQTISGLHGPVKDIYCRARVENIPIRNKMGNFKVHFPKSMEMFPMKRLMENSEGNILSTRETCDPEIEPILCPCCHVRIIDTVLFSCGCMVCCGYCLGSHAFETCYQCGARVVGYAKVIIT